MPKKIFNSVLILLLAFFSFLMLRITLQYFKFNEIVAFLNLKVPVWDNMLWRTAFYVHVLSSMFVIVAGFTQFSKKFLTKYPIWHRRLGYMYILVLLFLSGPSGLIMAFYAFGGIVAKIAFVTLSLLWIVFTVLAWKYALKKKFVLHENFMMRSYALTLSAITLRSWKYLITLFFIVRPKDLYIFIAWFGFVPNLLIAEWLISRKRKKRRNA